YVFSCRCHVVDIFLRRKACFLRFLFNFLAMLVHSRQKPDVKTTQALVTDHCIGRDCRISRSDMEFSAWIINGCSEVKCFVFSSHEKFLQFLCIVLILTKSTILYNLSIPSPFFDKINTNYPIKKGDFKPLKGNFKNRIKK